MCMHPRLTCVGERRVAERIARTEVDPEWTWRVELEDVVPLVVLSVVKGARRRLARAQPEGRRLRSYGAESAIARAEQQRAIASHRDSADRDSLCVCARGPSWNRLPQDHRTPASIRSVVPVAVRVPVEQ